jgi:TonB family protein
MKPEVVMPAARFVACVIVASACLSCGAAMTVAASRTTRLSQAPDAAAPRTPLGIVRRAPVEVPADLDPRLGRVLVQLEADVAADGTVTDVRLLAVSVVAAKVEMTADPDALRKDFDAMVKASSASLRQWRFEPPAGAPAVVRVPIYFDVVAGRTAFGSIRPMSGYPPHVSAVPPSDALKVGGAIQPPKRLVNVPPRYPDDALQAKVQGVVVLDVVVDRDGVPTDVQVSKGVPMLDEAAIEAVRQWRYEPTLMNGAPVPVAMTVTVNFTLEP